MATEYFNDAWRIPNNKNQSLVSNYSMEFNGGENVNISPEVDLGINSTVSVWTNFSSALNFVILGNNLTSNYLLYADATSIYARINTVFKTFTHSIVLNQWYNIILVRTGDSIEVFQNGNSLGTQTGYGTTVTTKISTIGSKPAGTFAVIGKIDQVSIFDYALPATGTNSVATLYGGGTAVTNPMSLSPKPVSYYQLGDQSVDNGANYLVPNNSLQDYVFDLITGDYISFVNGLTMARQQNISYSAWVNTTNLSTTQYIVGNNNSSNQGTSIFILNTASYPDRLVFQFGDLVNFNNQSYFNSIVSNLSTYVSANEWFHVAASWDGTTSKIYINGIERNSWTPTQPPTYTISNWGSFRIGRRGDSATSYFNGMLSNVAFWDNGLTPSQVITLYNNGVPGDISSLSPVSWWKLNAQDTFDGTNWTIKDYAGSNDGTSNGMDSSNLVVSDLQHTSGFSPYALSLSGGGEFMYTNISALTSISTITTSIWIKLSTTNFGYALNINGNNSTEISFGYNSGKFFFYSGAVQGYAANPSSAGVWYNIVLTRSGDTQKMYIDGVLEATATGLTTLSLNDYVLIGKRNNGFNIAADVSNLAIWSSELTTSQITTLYNQGLPSNLSTFSTKPIFWSQFGTNSSFNAAANRWTSIDEISGNNVLSHTVMAGDDITNGVGYSANGLGTSSIEIIGDAPYSTANGISNSMDVLSRSTDLPPTV